MYKLYLLIEDNKTFVFVMFCKQCYVIQCYQKHVTFNIKLCATWICLFIG